MRNKKVLTIHEYELPVTLEKAAEGGFVAQCTKWKDCYAQGETIEEAINELTSVASSLIELYREEKFRIPLRLKQTAKRSLGNLSFKFPLIVSS